MMEFGEVPVKLGVEGQELGAGTGEERLEFPDGHFDVVETGLGEDVGSDDSVTAFTWVRRLSLPPGCRRPSPLLHWQRRVA